MDNITNLIAQISSDPLPRATVDASFPNIIRLVSIFAALLSVVFVAVGGLKYTLSNGDPAGIQKAKNTIMYALVGLVVTLSAYVIIGFVTGSLG